MKTISFLDQTSAHLPELMSKADRTDLSLDKIIATDMLIGTPLTNKIKVAWLIEPECVMPQTYKYIKDRHERFEHVLTHSRELLDLIPNAKFVPFGTTFLREDEIKIYEKSKMVSMVASGKKFTPGHRFRHEVLNSLRGKIDLFGREINPIDRKIEGLKDYRYSIAIENSKHDYWFTEKLLDCFLSGTVPIYWGCPSLDKFFNMSGVIAADSVDVINQVASTLNENDYISRKEAIEENFKLAKQYINTYDTVYKIVEDL